MDNASETMPNSYFHVMSKQLLIDLQILKDLYPNPFPKHEDIWEYEYTPDNIQAAVEKMPPYPQFEYVAAPGKSHGEFLVSWRKLEDLTAKWANRVHIGAEGWPAEKVVVCEVLKAIGEARPFGATQRRYSGQEARSGS